MAAPTREKAREPAQNSPGAPPSAPVDQTARRAEATRLVASWLGGRSFGWSHHPEANLPDATELIMRLNRAGYIVWFVGDCIDCAQTPGLCDVHD